MTPADPGPPVRAARRRHRYDRLVLASVDPSFAGYDEARGRAVFARRAMRVEPLKALRVE